jgi:hypothetical protein
LMNAGLPISRRATSRASSWRLRGILRDGSLGQHRIFNGRLDDDERARGGGLNFLRNQEGSMGLRTFTFV